MDAADLTLAEQALAQITTFITQGDMPLGSIINEVELSKRLSMSRGPVREAIRRLQGRNLVTRSQHHRARVINMGPTEVREIFEFREALEGMACRLASKSMSDADLERLARAVEGNGGADFDIHTEIAIGCGNARIANYLCNDLYYLLRVYRKRSAELTGRHEQTQEEHWQIVKALKLRDADLAESLMRAHIRRAISHLSTELDKLEREHREGMK